MSKYDIITIGSATRDVYLESPSLKSVESEDFVTGKGVCVPEGSKVSVENIYFTTGGSAVNAAITFANQGLVTSIICKTGEDSRGLSIQQRLMEARVDTESILIHPEKLTAYSVVVHSPDGERSIFVYRGASSTMNKEEFPFESIKNTEWIFVTHLGGDSAAIFSPLLKFAKENGVKVALNPGSTQLKMGKKLTALLDNVDVLFVNQEEASILTGVNYEEEKEVFKKLDEWVGGIVVMTKGPEGVTVSDGSNRWDAPALKEPKFMDRTGAGDAFASGFTTAIIRGESIEEAIQLGSANATGVVGEWGANNGVLNKEDKATKFGKLKIKKSNL